jgi:hypothetical protein
LALAKLSIEVPSTVQVEEPAKEQAQIDLFAELSFAADGVPGHEEQGVEEPFGRQAGSSGLAVGGGERVGHAGEDAIGPTFDVAQGAVGPDAIFDVEHMKQGQLPVGFAAHDRLPFAILGV